MRLNILGDDEIEALFGLPHFTHDERVQYFTVAPPETAALEQLHSVASRIYFILQLGYFKARRMFFVFNFPEVEEDVTYIQQQYFPNFVLTALSITKTTRLKHQHLILQLCNYRSCNARKRHQLKTKAHQAAVVCARPIYVFRELVNYMEEQRIVVPGYSFLQDAVREALAYEEHRLMIIVRNHLQDSAREALELLLQDSSGMYELTQLKHEPKDFDAGEIRREILRGERILDLYRLAKKVLLKLKISNESIKYYASLVTYYSVSRLTRLDINIVRVYLLCFVHYRYQKIRENLLNSLIYHVRKYIDESKAAAKERVYTYHIEGPL
jgi:hypothetical protein